MSVKEHPTGFDINKFPKGWGMIVFPISLSRTSNSLTPQVCIDALYHFREKISENKVGVHFLYTEGLYMNLEDDAYRTKNRFAQTAVSHMLGVRNLARKNYRDFQIEAAFSFQSWFQMYLSHKDFFNAYKTVQDFYENDKEFQQEVLQDAQAFGQTLNDRQRSFFLEEHTFTYLLLNRQLALPNTFVDGREEWILLAYPERPPRGSIYLTQSDPLNLNDDENPYKGQYVISEQIFLDFLKTNLHAYQPTAK